jgi:hypothetical protein
VVDFLEALIKLDFTWTEKPDETETVARLNEHHPGHEYPIYRAEDVGQWHEDFMQDAKSIAIATQIHCHSSTCHKKGTACRFHYDGDGKPLFAITVIDLEKGHINIKRAHPMVNNHNPALATVIRANHDISAIFTSCLQGLQTMFYMTGYMAKGEDDVSDVTALKDTFRQLQASGIIPNSDMVEQTRRLMIRMNYLRQSGRQFSGAQVAAMLLRIGNDGMHYTDSLFTRLPLFQFIRYLKSQSNGNSYVRIPDREHWDDSDPDGNDSESDNDANSEVDDGAPDESIVVETMDSEPSIQDANLQNDSGATDSFVGISHDWQGIHVAYWRCC